MAVSTDHVDPKLAELGQVVGTDVTFAPHRPHLRPGDDEETLYVKWRKLLLFRQLKTNRILYNVEGDRRANYLYAREALLSCKFPSRNRTRRSQESGSSSRSSTRTGSRLVRNSMILYTKLRFLLIIAKYTDLNIVNWDKNKDSNEDGERKTTTAALQMKAAEWYNFRGMHHIMEYHTKAITRIKFGQDDKGLFASASEDGTVCLVDLLASNIDATKLVLKGHKAEVTDFCFSIENDYLVSSSMDKSIMVWETKTGKFVRGFEDPDPITCVMFHPINDHLLIYGNSRGEVKFVSFSNGSQVAYFKVNNPVTCIAFDGTQCTTMFVGDSWGELTLLSVKYAANEYQLESTGLARLNRSPIYSIEWRNQQTAKWSVPTLLIAQYDQPIKMLAIRKVDQRDSVQELAKFPRMLKRSKTRAIYCPVVHRGDLPCIAVGSENGTIYIYGYAQTDEKKTSKVTLVNQLAGHGSNVGDLAWNHDESLLASCDKSGVVIIWKRVDPKLV